MKKITWLVGLALPLLLIGYVALGPLITVYGIKTGIAEEDTKRLDNNIDFPLLRQNLKDQIGGAINKNTNGKSADNPLAAFAAGFAGKMADRVVDSFVTPSGLAAIMSGQKTDKEKSDDKEDKPKKEKLFKDAKFSYDSLSQFSAKMINEKGKEVQFIFQRQGLSWKLVNIILPT